jgi:hypothetical protein
MGQGNSGFFKGTKGNIKYPGDDPAKSPGPDFQWRGQGEPSSGKGSWFNPTTKEKWYPDLLHSEPIGPHWDYTDKKRNNFRVFKDGRIEPKK